MIIGDLEVKEVKKDTAISTLTGRYNISSKLNLDIKLPFKYRIESILGYTDKNDNNDISKISKKSGGIGDIELTLSQQNNGLQDRTSVYSVGIKTRTGSDPYDLENDKIALGTGHYALKFDYTQMRNLDPILLFANLSYSFNLKRNVADYGTVDPGDTFQYSLGLAYALSDRVSFNGRFAQSFTGYTRIDSEKQTGSNYTEANLYLGLNYLNLNNINYEYVLGIGLAEDSPDFSFTISRPINF